MHFFATANLEKRWLCDIEKASVDDRAEMAIKKREQKRANVRTIDIGIGGDDYFVIAELADVKDISNSGTHSHHQIADLLRREHLVQSRTFDVENFATQWKHSLGATIAAGLGRTTCGVSLYDEYLALFCSLGLAVGELTGECHAIECALAHDAVFGGFGGFAGLHSERDFADDGPSIIRVFLEKLSE